MWSGEKKITGFHLDGLFRIGSYSEKENSGGKSWRKSCRAAAIAACFACCSAYAQETELYNLHLINGTLGERLAALANETGYQLIFPTEELDQATSVRLVGAYSLNSAVDALLSDTGFSAVVTERGVIVVSREDPKQVTGRDDVHIKKSTLLTSVSALITSMFSSQVLAQAGGDAADQAETDVIVVEGFRRSLESALETKRDADSIVDSISSEGIGRFPDLNLGEALQRVTGVQIERGERRRAEISIRGLPRKFALTRVNGQALASPDLQNAFSFGIFESSIFSGADVIKTPTVEMDDGGLSGIVNVKTARPLDFNENNFSIGGGIGYESLPDAITPGINGKGNYSFSDDFAVFFAAAWSSPEFQRDQNQITDYDPDGADIQVADDFRYQSTRTSGDRVSATAGAEWRADESLTFGVNGIFSQYKQSSVRDTLRIRNCDDTAVDIVGDTAVTSTHAGCRFEAGSRVREDFDRSWALTGDAEWVNGPWRANVVAHYTKGEHDGFLFEARSRIDDDTPTTNATSVSVNTGGGVPDDYAITITGLDINDVNTWISGAPDQESRFFPNSSANRETIDEEFAAQFDLERELDFGILSSVKAGFKYRDREQQLRDTEGDDIDDDAVALTADLFRSTVGQEADYVVPDFSAVLDALLPLSAGPDDLLTDEGFVLVSNEEFLTTQQEILAGYFMANFDSNDMDLPIRVRGNAGVRIIRTNRTAMSFLEIEDNILGDSVELVSEDFSFTNVLPAANIIFDLSDNLLLRASYSETIVRPDPDVVQAGNELEVDDDDNSGALDGPDDSVDVEFNDPTLKPTKSNSVDVSLEWYNRPGSAFTIAFFHKNISDRVVETAACPTDLSLIPGSELFADRVNGALNGDIDDCQDALGVEYSIERVFNSPQSFNVKGFEFALLQNFDFLPGALGNFGVQANYTFITAGDVLGDDGEFRPLEDTSKHTMNFITYYETDRWGLRVAQNYRTSFFSAAAGGTAGGNRTIDSRYQMDLSANYNVTDNVSLGFEAFNLTNADVYEFDGVAERLRDSSREGRTFFLTGRLNF